MNTEVKATGMQVKAKAEKGILINEVATSDDTNWDEEAKSGQTSAISLHATSTANTKTWYTASSKKSADGAGAAASSKNSNLNGDYITLGSTGYTTKTETVAAVEGASAKRDITYIDADADNAYDDGEGYYVMYTYYVKSSGDAISCDTAANGTSFRIKEVKAEGASDSEDLDKALRVGVVVNSKAYIYAPLNSSVGTYYVAATTATTPLTGLQATSLQSIPAKTADGTPVYVYIWFEGEDPNCMTDNITATLDSLTIDVTFSLNENGSSSVTDNGVTVA